MKKISIFVCVLCLTVMVSCKKNEDTGNSDFENLKSQVLAVATAKESTI